MSSRPNQLEGWRRSFAVSLVALVGLMLWLAADVAAHHQLHALCESVDELQGHAGCDHGSDTRHADGDDHCAITLFQQGKIDSPEAPSVGAGIEFAPVHTSPSRPERALIFNWTGRLPFNCGPPV